MKIGLILIDDEIVIVADPNNLDAVAQKLVGHGRMIFNAWTMDFDQLPEGFGTVEVSTRVECHDATEYPLDF